MTKKRNKKSKPAAASQTSKTKKGGVSGKSGKQSREAPAPRVTFAQVDMLVASVRRFDRRLRNIEERQEEEHQRREQERQEQERRAAAPTPPALHEDLFNRLTQFMTEMTETVQQIASSVQQPVPAANHGAAPSVTKLRRFLAAACKAWGYQQPTPAIIGRVMHEKRIFTREDDRPPRALFETIYAKPNVANHLSPRIRGLLERYGEKPPQTNTSPDLGATSLNQSRQSRKKPKAASSKIAEKIGEEFDKRFELIVDIECGAKEPVRNGRKTNYRRYLTPEGRELFNGWPEWTDATGGISLVNQQTESPPSEPESTGPDGGSPSPAT